MTYGRRSRARQQAVFPNEGVALQQAVSNMLQLDVQLHDWIDSGGWFIAALVRLALAATCGAMVGLEREVRGRQAGFRTNLLVCLGCAIIMIVSLQVGNLSWEPRPNRN